MVSDDDGRKLFIAIVDDHPLTRYALKSLIDEDPAWEVCHESGSPSELVDHLAFHVPDVIIVDLCYADESGMDLLAYIKEHHPEIRTLVYSSHEEREYAQDCFRSGACGYISKQDPVRNVKDAIRCVNQGYTYISESLTQSVMGDAFIEGISDEETSQAG